MIGHHVTTTPKGRKVGSKARKEALLNQFKGHLFEYLLGHSLARKLGIEGEFLRSVSPVVKRELEGYQNALYRLDQELAQRLPILGQKTASKVLPYLPFKPQKILLLGMGELSHEGDLALIKGDQVFYISLKLCREGAFVNTKSAGVRSFLSKYFMAPKEQEQLNRLLDYSFDIFAHKLHENLGFTYQGSWHPEWNQGEEENQLPELPGDLNSEQKEFLLAHYQRVIEEIYRHIERLYQKDQTLFTSSLSPLLGFARSDILQVTCFYHQEGESIFVLNREKLTEFTPQLSPPASHSSFEILLGKFRLQIRVKPMNKFIARALKINCSLKKDLS